MERARSLNSVPCSIGHCSKPACRAQPTSPPRPALFLSQLALRPRNPLLSRADCLLKRRGILQLNPGLRQAFIVTLAWSMGLSTACNRKPSGNEITAALDGQKIDRADPEK